MGEKRGCCRRNNPVSSPLTEKGVIARNVQHPLIRGIIYFPKVV